MSDLPTYPPTGSAAESIAYWNRQFNLDFKKLFGGLVKLASGYVQDRPDQIALGAADAIQCASHALPPEGQFWLLVRRSLDAALPGLVAQSPCIRTLARNAECSR